MSRIIEVTGTQPLVTVDDNVSNVSVVNQPLEVTVESAVAVGNITIRNALGAVPPIRYDKNSGVISFLDRSEVIRSERMMDAVLIPIYGGENNSAVNLDAENFDIFTIQIAGDITEFDFSNITPGQTVTIICSQSTTPGQIDETSGNWNNWFWSNNNNHFPGNPYDAFMIKVLWTGNTYYASLIEFETVMPTTQVGIPVGPIEPSNPEPGWLWYDTDNSLLMIYVDGAWVVAGGGGGASVHVGDTAPDNPEQGDLWFNTSIDPDTLQVYNNNQWNNSEGLQGPRGYTGSRGTQGAQGYTGSQGIDGIDGFTGSQGDIGFTGSASTVPGVRGYTGSQGDQGEQGDTGYSGSTGFTGSASTAPGFTGSKGDKGDDGYTGSAGFTGSASTAPGFTGSIGFTGSKGDTGFTGSASTAPGYTGSAGDQGLIGFTGSQGDQGIQGFTGSKGDQGIIGFTGSQGIQGEQGPAAIGMRGYTGSKGEDGQGVIQAEPPQDTDREIQYARVYKSGADDGNWEEIVSTGGGEWDGVLYDKSAVIDQATTEGDDLTKPSSGITIGKNGFLNSTDNPLPMLNDEQKNNLVIGRNSYLNGQGFKNVTLIGSDMPLNYPAFPTNLLPGDTTESVNQNVIVLGNNEHRRLYLGGHLFIGKDSVTSPNNITITPQYNSNLVLKAKAIHAIELLDDTIDGDVNRSGGVHIRSNRVVHGASKKAVPGSEPLMQYNPNIRREVYYDTTNILSGVFTVSNTDEFDEMDATATWSNRRHINYFSPEKIQFRKFAECVTTYPPDYVNPDPTTKPELANNTYAGPNMDIDLYQGSIQHRIMTNDVGDVDILDRKYGPTSTFSTNQLTITEPDAGTSITIILYHSDTVKTITWPSNFKFLGGESELTTEAGSATTENINGNTVENIVAIDMLHAFYDGYNWWASITRGYA